MGEGEGDQLLSLFFVRLIEVQVVSIGYYHQQTPLQDLQHLVRHMLTSTYHLSVDTAQPHTCS